jgi:hypothetical protein
MIYDATITRSVTVYFDAIRTTTDTGDDHDFTFQLLIICCHFCLLSSLHVLATILHSYYEEDINLIWNRIGPFNK